MPQSARWTRAVDPHHTNAILVSPQTSRVLRKPDTSSRNTSDEPGTATTTNILDKALAHLVAVEPLLKPCIDKHTCHPFSPSGLAEKIDPFHSLASGIISQQVSGAAAKSIKAKFVGLFRTDDSVETQRAFPTPLEVVGKDVATLKRAGLSQRKAEYIYGLAEKFAKNELTTEMLLNADYEEVLERLIAVRGLGRWSVEMFALFGLKRMDVFSTGDLGVQRGMAALAGKNVSSLKAKGGKWKYMREAEMLEMASRFAPYRSIFMWYLWRYSDEVDLTSFEQ
jgi:DNA-3-methyladenine glycosylase II